MYNTTNAYTSSLCLDSQSLHVQQCTMGLVTFNCTVMSQRDTVCNEIFSLLVIIKKWSDYSCAVLYNVLQLTLVTGKKKSLGKSLQVWLSVHCTTVFPKMDRRLGIDYVEHIFCPMSLLWRKKKREGEERESKPIYNLSLSLPWWLDDGWLHPL